MSLVNYLNKPYPLHLRRWPLIISISAFISIFMLLFQPFGLQNFVSDHKTLLLSGYGMVTFLVLCLNLLLLPRVLKKTLCDDRWTIFKEIIWIFWIIFTIALGNYAYSTAFSITHWIGIEGIMLFLAFTLAIGIIPVVTLTILSHNILLKKNLAETSGMNIILGRDISENLPESKSIVLESESGKQEFAGKMDDLICIESDGNYIDINYLKNGKIAHTIIRNTLKSIESQVEGHESLFKCHRAFIVNLYHIQHIIGNSQGYRLRMTDKDEHIPVARSYSKTFREAFSLYKKA